MQKDIFKSILVIFLTGITITLYAQYSTLVQNRSEKRLALVIGNASYTYSGELANPVNDARAMKNALQKVNFEVLEYENLTQSQLKKAIDEFGNKLKNYSTGLFFYAGHGIQSKGYNYLIPIDANLQTEQQIEYDCVQADRILGLMESAGSTVNIVILDACRNNPFERSWSRSTNGSGLAFMNAPSGSLIAYATSPGRTASDGSGSNGLYTSALLENINTPNITILQMFQKVRREVSERSYKQQIPWESTSLTADFYFASPDNTGNTSTTSSSAFNKTASYKWKQSSEGYWFYKNDENIASRLISSWADDDLLVYDPEDNKTFLLKNYKTSKANSFFNALLVDDKENALWKAKDGLFWFYLKGDQIAQSTKSITIDNDVLVYCDKNNYTYMLKNYKFDQDNQLRKASVLDNSESAFWQKQNNSYWLYVKGSDIQYRTKSAWVGNNLMVYDEQANTTYLFPDYSTSTNSELKPAQVVSYIDNIFWMKQDNNYFFYVKGEQVAKRTTNKWSGNDLLVTDPYTNTTYILQDYQNAPQLTLRPALLFSN